MTHLYQIVLLIESQYHKGVSCCKVYIQIVYSNLKWVTIWQGNIVTFYNTILQDVYDAGLLMNGFGSLEGLQQWHHGERFVLNKYLLLSHIFVI